MEIDIHQKEIALGNKYEIFLNGLPAYAASTELLQLYTVINLMDYVGQVQKLKIHRRPALFASKYDINLPDGSVLEFRTKSFWKNHFQCAAGPDRFDIYGHRGRKFSIFKNERQVAWWTKEAISWFEGDTYRIIADNDSDYELYIAFCLIIDHYAGRKNGNNMITIDLGSIGQARKFDPAWQPR